jgi:hypothetical protein
MVPDRVAHFGEFGLQRFDRVDKGGPGGWIWHQSSFCDGAGRGRISSFV